MRFVIANLCLFAGYTGVSLVHTWSYVARGQQYAPIDVLVAAFLWSAPAAACFANWWLLRIANNTARVAIGIAIGLLVCAIAFVPFFLIVLTFHTEIGGTL